MARPDPAAKLFLFKQRCIRRRKVPDQRKVGEDAAAAPDQGLEIDWRNDQTPQICRRPSDHAEIASKAGPVLQFQGCADGVVPQHDKLVVPRRQHADEQIGIARRELDGRFQQEFLPRSKAADGQFVELVSRGCVVGDADGYRALLGRQGRRQRICHRRRAAGQQEGQHQAANQAQFQERYASAHDNPIQKYCQNAMISDPASRVYIFARLANRHRYGGQPAKVAILARYANQA